MKQFQIGSIQSFRFVFAQTSVNLQPGIAKDLQATASDARERISHRCDYTPDSSFEYGIGAGRRFAPVATRLKCYDQGSTSGFFACGFQGKDLCVWAPEFLVPAFACEFLRRIQNHGPNEGIRFYKSSTPRSKRKSMVHPDFELIHKQSANKRRKKFGFRANHYMSSASI
jgi:hypothetical protein